MSASQLGLTGRLCRKLVHGARWVVPSLLLAFTATGVGALATAGAAGAATGSAAATVTVSASPAIAAPGTPVTLTAVVAPAEGGPTPTGTVQFYIGGVQVGSTSCTTSSGAGASCLDSTGTATATLSNIASGTYDVEASYSGDSNYAKVAYQSSAFFVLTISTTLVDNTTTTLSVSPQNITNQQSANLVATVVDENDVPVTSGQVTFFNLTTNATIGYANLMSSGTASLTTGSWPVGTFEIEATYVGPITFGASGATAWLTVTNAVTIDNTDTSLSISPPLITADDATLLSASVVDENGIPMTAGTVTFFNVTTNVVIGNVTMNSSSPGQADLLVGDWPSGTFTIEATYEGPDTTAPSADSGQLEVLQVAADTSTTITSITPSQLLSGQSTEITASVASSEATTPTGTVTFYDDGTEIGTVTLGSDLTATLDYSGTLAPGMHEITAVYNGDTVDEPSPASAPATLTVQSIDTSTTAAAASPASSALGSSVQLSATVSPGTSLSGTPTGTVSFHLGSASGMLLCTASMASGKASCPTTALPLGSDTVVATYSGDSGHAGSSGSTTATVTPAASTTIASASPASSKSGSSVALSATVSSASGLAITPTGTVSFHLGSASGTLLCSASLVSGQASCSTTALPVGSDTVVATYAGDPNFQSSSASAKASVTSPITVTVSGSQASGSSSPSFTYQAQLPTGVTLSGTLSCTRLSNGKTIASSLASGSYQIDPSSCSGLSASSSYYTLSYAGGTFVVTATCSDTGTDSISAGNAQLLTTRHSGNIAVAQNKSYYVDGGTVQGSVTVASGASLFMSSGSITGSISASSGSTIIITGGTVSGSLSAVGSAVSINSGATLDGGVSLTGGSFLDQGASIVGSLSVSGASWVAICGGSIKGSVAISSTTGTPPTGVSTASPSEDYVCEATITGSLAISGNANGVAFEVGTGPDCGGKLVVDGSISYPGNGGGNGGGGQGGGSGQPCPPNSGGNGGGQGDGSGQPCPPNGGGNGGGQGGGSGQPCPPNGGGNGGGQGGGSGQPCPPNGGGCGYGITPGPGVAGGTSVGW